MLENWLPSLKTKRHEEGFKLAVKLSRMGVKSTECLALELFFA